LPAFRKLDAVAVLTARLLPAPQVSQRSSARYRHWQFRCCSNPDARRAEQAQTGRHPQDQGPRQVADGTAAAQAAQATAEADALAEALQAARAAQQAAETAAAALRDAREQAAQAAAREQAAAT
jgi:hypothetical protein